MSVIPRQYHDWIVTACLYTAMHAVEALLHADRASNHGSHGLRHQILESNPRYRPIFGSYKVAYDLAHVSRYSSNPRRWVAWSNIGSVLFVRSLYPVEDAVRNLLAPMGIVLPNPGPITLMT